MKQRRWLLIAVALALASFAPYGLPPPAHAQGSDAEAFAVPRNFFDFPRSLPGVGRFLSTVDDFAGIGAVANIQGTGKDNKGNAVTWEVDARVFQGAYVGTDGTTRRGTFGFA
jgi:hypothetical protein